MFGCQQLTPNHQRKALTTDSSDDRSRTATAMPVKMPTDRPRLGAIQKIIGRSHQQEQSESLNRGKEPNLMATLLDVQIRDLQKLSTPTDHSAQWALIVLTPNRDSLTTI